MLFEAATGEPAFDYPDADELDSVKPEEPYESDEPYEPEDLATSERADESEYPQLLTPARRADELRPLPDELTELIAACFRPEPARRPGVEELLGAFEPIAGLPVTARRHAEVRR